MIYKTLHRKLKIEQHEHQLNLGGNASSPEGNAVHVSLVAPVVLPRSLQIPY
jgi:hypothetical protein